ncbi:nucleoporin NDC1, partial [Tremellales sp. Uapishka_1]
MRPQQRSTRSLGVRPAIRTCMIRVGNLPPLDKIESQYRLGSTVEVPGATMDGIYAQSCAVDWGVAFPADIRALREQAILHHLFVPLGRILLSNHAVSNTVSPPKLPSRSTNRGLLVTALTSARYLRLVASYLSFSATLTLIYGLLLEWRRPDSELGFWTATPRHPWHLNERLIFLFLGNGFLFLALAFRDIFGHRLDATWPKKKMTLSKAVQATLVGRIPTFDEWTSTANPASITLISTSIYTLSYFVSRGPVWRFLITHFAGMLRPFIVNFAKPSRNTLGWSMIVHLLWLDVTSLAILKIPTTAMMAYLTQPLDFTSFTRKSPMSADRYLLTALRSQNTYHLNFTIMELLRVSQNPTRRKAIFTDMSTSPSLTHQLWEELLLALGRSYTTLVTRGGGSSTAAVQQAATPRQPDPRSLPVKQADIFKPNLKHKSTISSFLDGPVRAMPPAPVIKAVRAVELAEQNALKQIDTTRSKVLGKIDSVPAGHAALRWKDLVLGSMSAYGAERYVDTSLPDLVLVQRIIEILINVSVASIEEDTYGHVQQVLPATLEAILRFRSAIRSFSSELASRTSGSSNNPQRGVLEVVDRIKVLDSACEQGIRRVGDTFGKSLGAFRFPPSIAGSLSQICSGQ